MARIFRRWRMSKPKGHAIQEFSAYGISKENNVACDVCLELPEEEWKEHVMGVLA